jgi:hypothetical protein
MSTKDYLKFYNEDKYWNMEQKEDFINSTRQLWRGNACKYNGSVVHIPHVADHETQMSMMKVDRELQEAIRKHGEVEVPK